MERHSLVEVFHKTQITSFILKTVTGKAVLINMTGKAVLINMFIKTAFPVTVFNIKEIVVNDLLVHNPQLVRRKVQVINMNIKEVTIWLFVH